MIGEKIKKLRTDRNITQETLANHLNVTPQAVSKWEQCLALPDISLLVPIADFFGVSVDQILREKIKDHKIDYSSFLEITKINRLVGANNCYTKYNFKNISSLSFKTINIKFLFKNDKGEVIDYTPDIISSLEPGYSYQITARTWATNKPGSIDIEVLDYELA